MTTQHVLTAHLVRSLEACLGNKRRLMYLVYPLPLPLSLFTPPIVVLPNGSMIHPIASEGCRVFCCSQGKLASCHHMPLGPNLNATGDVVVELSLATSLWLIQFIQ